MKETDQRTAGPNFFRDDEFVQFMRADSLVGHSFSDNILRLSVRTIHLVKRTAQTHDTVMHQFLTEKDSFGQMSFELAFVTPEIFRVKFAGRSSTLEDLTDDPQFPPPGGRMLCGIPQIVASTVEEDCKGCITLKSTAVELKIQPKPFRLLAYRLAEKAPFWKQRLSDLFTSDVIPTSISSHKGREASFEAFVLDPQKEVFGLGERFGRVGRRGRPVDFVNHDAIGTSSPRTYINVPFFWSTKG
jgi:alpha-D-xyloside xylohydrolase